MHYQEASTVLDEPLEEVETRIADVESWSGFLIGVEAVERLGHERYRFRLVDGRDRRDSVVCVRRWPADHRFRWRSLDGPTFAGMLELRATDERHTAVRLTLTSHPGTFMAGLAEMVLPRMGRAAHDLRNLEAQLSTGR
jgi:uncharacterized membrane protein